MTKEDFLKNLKEAIIFNEYKDRPMSTIENFNNMCIRKYGEGNYRNIALRIINYQVDTYDEEVYSQNQYKERRTHANKRI